MPTTLDGSHCSETALQKGPTPPTPQPSPGLALPCPSPCCPKDREVGTEVLSFGAGPTLMSHSSENYPTKEPRI